MDANRANVTTPEESKDRGNDEAPCRAVREYLVALEEANPTGDKPSAPADPIAAARVVSLSDPASRYTAAPGGPAFFAYSTNYLIDLDSGIIMDIEATPAHRTLKVESTKSMVQRVEERFEITPHRLVGDTAYGSAPMLHWLVNEKGIEPHVPVWDKTQRKDGTLSSNDFQWNERANEYCCPEGHALQINRRPFKNPRTHITQEDTIIYRASQHDCAACPSKVRCCPNTPARKIARSIHESARDVARKIAQTDAFRQSGRQPKKVEMLFAHLKRILKLDRLWLRGLSGAQDEFLLAATAQNLRRMAKWLIPGNGKAASIPA